MYKTQLIKPPRREDDQVRYPDGVTTDIVETVLFADKKSGYYTKEFAASLKGKTLIDTCRNIWEFVKKQIPYVLDPAGDQNIKSPGRLWQEKAGDCKSFSVFTASCLKNLGIPYGFRFASYSKTDPTPTHVYVYVPIGNKEIILDSVWTGPFNTQKTYTFKQDKLMSRIAYLGTTSPRKDNHVPGELKLTKPIDQLSDGEFTLLLARQRLEIDKANSAAVGGPFNWQIEKYDKAIGVVNAALANIDNADEIYKMGERFERDALLNGKQAHVGGFFKKIGQGIKKGFKAITKVLSFPLRLVVKGMIEIYIPKSAPMFLYLFADEKALPDKMRAKRKKAQKFKDFIVNKIGMKNAHFMAIIRNALTKKYKKSPETFLANAIKNIAIKGIGDIGKAKKKVNNQKRRRIITNVNNQSSADSRSNAGMKITDRLTEAAYNNTQDDNSDQQPKQGIDIKSAITEVSKGNFFGAAIGIVFSAIKWIISKLGGKKAGVDITENDMPDLEGDSGNAISEDGLQKLSNLPQVVIDKLRETATTLINNGSSLNQAQSVIKDEFPSLTTDDREVVKAEIQTGFDPLTGQQGQKAFDDIKKQAPGTGMCNC